MLLDKRSAFSFAFIYSEKFLFFSSIYIVDGKNILVLFFDTDSMIFNSFFRS